MRRIIIRLYVLFMYRLKINESQIAVGESYRNAAGYIPAGRRVIVITDANILKYYGDFLSRWDVIETGIGEQNKTLDAVAAIYRRLLACSADRSCFILAVGGGVVCDVAGFAASTFMRGVPFGFVSTSLLSQVDASIGGKNGVNFDGYKNIAGVFNQPLFVLCDVAMLQTLPEREYISGFAEIVKAAAICSAGLFGYLEENVEKALTRDTEVISHLIAESVKIKADVVSLDEREHGVRRILNFGHTLGHAVEAVTGIAHGEAVSIGMMFAARLSAVECGFPQIQMYRLERLLAHFGLPVTADAPPLDILQNVFKDKKREKKDINFVLLSDIGKAVIRKLPLIKIKKIFM